MLLTDFVMDTYIEVEATLKMTNRKIVFSSMIVNSYYSQDSILIKSILLNGKLVHFDACNCNILVYRDGKSPILFKNVEIKNVEINGKKYHNIISSFEGEKYNRRKEFRCIIEKNCDIYIDDNKFEGLLRNISNSGHSFLLYKKDFKDFKSIKNKIIKIYFKDTSIDGKNFSFDLQGSVIWFKENIDTIFFGGELTKGFEDIPNYIMVKQREELKKLKGKRK